MHSGPKTGKVPLLIELNTMEREEKIHKQQTKIISTFDGCPEEYGNEHRGV